MTSPTRESLIATLHPCRTFAGLNPDEINALLDIAEPQRFDPGATVFKEHDALQGGYILLSGRVELSESLYPERRVCRQAFTVGNLFGIGGFIKGWPSRHSCLALEDTATLYVERRAFLRLIDAGEPVALRLIDDLLDLYVQDIHTINQTLDDIYSRPHDTLDLLRRLQQEPLP